MAEIIKGAFKALNKSLNAWRIKYSHRRDTHMTIGEFLVGQWLLLHQYRICQWKDIKDISRLPPKSFIYGYITPELSITKRHHLHLDFLIKLKNSELIAIEYDGAQHVNLYDTCRNANSYMSGERLVHSFLLQLHNDELTEQYCRQHDIKFLRLVDLNVKSHKRIRRGVNYAMAKLNTITYDWFRITNAGHGYFQQNGSSARQDILYILGNNYMLAKCIMFLAYDMNQANNKRGDYFGPEPWNVNTKELKKYINKLNKQVNIEFDSRM